MPESSFWYSFIAASPTPESGEVVNVGILVGNGRATHLEFEPRLPRLSGLVAADEIGVYEQILRAAADRVQEGADPATLQALLGAQLVIAERRELFRQPDSRLVKRLVSHYLTTPSVPYGDDARLLAKRASRQLEEIVVRVRPPHISVEHKVTPKSLYEASLDRFVQTKVPQITHALRSDHRDLLVDSVIFDRPENVGRSINQALSRIAHAYWAYGRLRPIIRNYAGRELLRVAILHPSDSQHPDVEEARTYVKEKWSADADVVIDGNREDIEERLRQEAEWLRRSA